MDSAPQFVASMAAIRGIDAVVRLAVDYSNASHFEGPGFRARGDERRHFLDARDQLTASDFRESLYDLIQRRGQANSQPPAAQPRPLTRPNVWVFTSHPPPPPPLPPPPPDRQKQRLALPVASLEELLESPELRTIACLESNFAGATSRWPCTPSPNHLGDLGSMQL